MQELYRPPRSMLCQPLLNQSKLIGLLYLENELTADAVTPDRLEVLQRCGTYGRGTLFSTSQ